MNNPLRSGRSIFIIIDLTLAGERESCHLTEVWPLQSVDRTQHCNICKPHGCISASFNIVLVLSAQSRSDIGELVMSLC